VVRGCMRPAGRLLLHSPLLHVPPAHPLNPPSRSCMRRRFSRTPATAHPL
jgi:hypothetical protein